MIELTTAELAHVIGGVVFDHEHSGVLDSVIGPIVVDSRLAVAGSVFFALQGEFTHGHEFAGSAVDSGAILVVAEQDMDVGAPVIVVKDSLAALSVLAKEVVSRVRSDGELRVVAVTGSNGKTTTKNMLRAILERAGSVVAPRDSFNNEVGAPLSMLSVDADTRFLVVEMGASAVGEIARLIDIVMPDVAIVLKVGLAHAGGFGSIEATALAKSEIVTQLPNDAVAVLNVDDDRVAAMAELTRARVVGFGLSPSADLTAENLRTTIRGTEFSLVSDVGRFDVALRILGEHNVMNALAALCAAREFGIAIPDAIEALEGMERAERWRMEILHAPNNVTVINDAYNASPDSMAAALKTLAEITRGAHRSLAVVGEMAELGECAIQEHDRIGRLAVRLNIDKLIVVGHGARHIHHAAGLEGSWNGESVFVGGVDEAYDLLRGELRSGDVVLVKSSNSAGLRLLGDRVAGVT